MITHTKLDPSAVSQHWLAHKSEVITSMVDAFSQYAVDNREALKSNQAGPEIAATIFNRITQFISGEASQFEIAVLAADFAKQGLALTTASQMMRVIWPQVSVETSTPHFINKLNNFQLAFLEKLAETREVIQLRAQEESQIALQQALYTQLEQQRLLRESVERHSRSLN